MRLNPAKEQDLSNILFQIFSLSATRDLKALSLHAAEVYPKLLKSDRQTILSALKDFGLIESVNVSDGVAMDILREIGGGYEDPLFLGIDFGMPVCDFLAYPSMITAPDTGAYRLEEVD